MCVRQFYGPKKTQSSHRTWARLHEPIYQTKQQQENPFRFPFPFLPLYLLLLGAHKSSLRWTQQKTTCHLHPSITRNSLVVDPTLLGLRSSGSWWSLKLIIYYIIIIINFISDKRISQRFVLWFVVATRAFLSRKALNIHTFNERCGPPITTSTYIFFQLYWWLWCTFSHIICLTLQLCEYSPTTYFIGNTESIIRHICQQY